MRIKYVIEQRAPLRRKTDKTEEDLYNEHFWNTINAVRAGKYQADPNNVNAVAEQVEEERRFRNS